MVTKKVFLKNDERMKNIKKGTMHEVLYEKSKEQNKCLPITIF